ncbi:MAG: transporter substrate-binding domain-containing protein, partial [Methylococcaceae bacterium]|nr:transporter substrate-binding domain-containing protein [Methylococcaceae bacterium]
MYAAKIKLLQYLWLVLFCQLIVSSVAYGSEITKITVAYNLNNPPFKFQNEKAQADGILIDIWRLWSQKTGVKVDFKAALFNDTLMLLKNGEADVHAGLFYTKERAQFLDYSPPILDLKYYLFWHDSIDAITSPDKLLPYRLGVPEGYAHQFALKQFPATSVQVFDNFPTLYSHALTGKIKTFISPVINLNYFLAQKNRRNDFRYKPSKELYSQHYLAAVKRGNKVLLELVNQGMQQISPHELVQIKRKWLQQQSSVATDNKVLIIATDSKRPPFSMLNARG